MNIPITVKLKCTNKHFFIIAASEIRIFKKISLTFNVNLTILLNQLQHDQ